MEAGPVRGGPRRPRKKQRGSKSGLCRHARHGAGGREGPFEQVSCHTGGISWGSVAGSLHLPTQAA